MSYTAHHRSHHDAYSLGARGSGVRASRDPRAATSGQAATTTTHPTAIARLTHPNQAKPESALPAFGLPWPWEPSWRARRASPSPVDLATGGQANDALAWHRAYTPLLAAPSGGRATTWSPGTPL
jgi:hypothetical protein